MTSPVASSRSHALIRSSRAFGGGQAWSTHHPLVGILAGVVAIALGVATARTAGAPTQLNALALIVACVVYLAFAFGVLRKLLLAVIVLDIPLGWDVHLGWRPEAADIGATGGFSLSVTTVALAALYAVWLSEHLVQRPSRRPRLQLRIALPLFVFVGFSALSMLVANDAELARFGLWIILQALLLFIYIASTITTRAQVLYVVWLLLIGLVFAALISLASVAGYSVDIAGVSTDVGPSGRVGGTIGSPNGAGAYFAMLLAPAAAVSLTAESARLRWLARFAFAAGLVALILTLSRGGWISFLISVAILSLWGVRSRWIKPRTVVIGAVALVALLTPFAGQISERVTGVDDREAAASRLPLMRLSGEIIRDHPVTGVGVNNFTVAIPEYAGPEFTGAFLYAAHNKYLLVWAEAGILALAGFAWFLLATVRRSWRVFGSRDPVLAPIGLAFAGAVVGQMVHMTVDTFQGRQAVQLLWLVAALVAAMTLLLAGEEIGEKDA